MADSVRTGCPVNLPSGQIIALDALVKQRAERERIESAIEKLRAKCGLAEPIVREIEQQFLQTLYLQAFAPQQWYAQAMAIVEAMLGDQFKALATRLSQVLFVCSRFHFAEAPPPEVLARYHDGEVIPPSILNASSSLHEHTMHDIQGYLNNRLGRTIIEILRREDCDIELFIGPKEDMLAYYRTREPALTMKGEIHSPTSTELYLFGNGSYHSTVAITGISNPSRFYHQLWQLKYAGIDLDRVRVRGSFEQVLNSQANALRHELAKLPVKPRIAIVGQRWWPMEILGQLAGISGPEGMAYNAIHPTPYQIGPFVFDYIIVEVAGAPAWRSKIGLVALRMPNGSLAGEAMDALVKNGTNHVLLAGAGGSLDAEAGVGVYQVFTRAAYGENVYELPESALYIPQLPEGFPLIRRGANITVDSPLAETWHWLKESRERGCSVVDVESAHILKALLSGAVRGDLRVTPGLFVSDVVGGDTSLIEKISADNAYVNLKGLLERYLLGVGVSGVYDAQGRCHRFTASDIPRNALLMRVAQSKRDAARRKVMGVRMRADDFRIVSRQRRKVGYPDVKSMMGHKSIVYLIPPAEADGKAYAAFLKNADPETLFFSFPADAPQAAIDAARAQGFETIVIVESNDKAFPRADYMVARDSGWGTYPTVAAANAHAVAVFGDPSPYAALLVKMDNENRPIFVLDRWADALLLDELANFDVFGQGELNAKMGKAIKFRHLENWVARVRPDIERVRLARVRDYAEAKTIIGVSGSSKIAQFDPLSTQRAFSKLLHGLDPNEAMFATGGTDYGVEKILHGLIRERFPAFKLIGFITNEGKGDDLGTPTVTIAGNDWFGKSVPFLNAIDLFITVAGGGVIRQELLMAHKAGIPTFPLAGSGMGTDEFLEEHPELPRYYTGEELVDAIKGARANLLRVDQQS